MPSSVRTCAHRECVAPESPLRNARHERFLTRPIDWPSGVSHGHMTPYCAPWSFRGAICFIDSAPQLALHRESIESVALTFVRHRTSETPEPSGIRPDAIVERRTSPSRRYVIVRWICAGTRRASTCLRTVSRISLIIAREICCAAMRPSSEPHPSTRFRE